MPLGFSPSKVIVHNASVCLLKCIANERLSIFDDHEGTVILNLIVTLLNYWIAELIPTDSYLLSMTIEILEILTKSGKSPSTLPKIFSQFLYQFQRRLRLVKFDERFKPEFHLEPDQVSYHQNRHLPLQGRLQKLLQR